MRIDARVLGHECLYWRVWDCARREFRHDVVYVDDGSQEYAMFGGDPFNGPLLRVQSRVAIVPCLKQCYINVDADPDAGRAPFTAVNELVATRGDLCVSKAG